MGRLFWKFLLFFWLAQMVAMLGVGAIFWWERQQQHAVQMFPAPPVDGGAPPHGAELRPPPPDWPPPPRDHARGHRNGFLPPIEPLLVGVLASLMFAALLAWYFSRPIRSLRAAFAAAATGNLDIRLAERMGSRSDELADLGHEFDRMAGQLAALMNGQRRLLHDVSHELRSPLARLQAAIGLLRKQPEKLEISLERIERESMRIDRLVGELLTLSRLEAGTGGPMDEAVPLGELLRELVEDARFEAEERQITLKAPEELIVAGNGEMLHRAIENVVRNALRHTPVDARVDVELSSEGDQVCIAVLDNGPGVADSELEAIFQPFHRAVTAEVTPGATTDGHGLGLAIARRIVDRHGGSIRASNRSEGGLRVEISLPNPKQSGV